MKIAILCFGFGHLEEWQSDLYRQFDFDPESADEDNFFVNWEGVSGDSEEAFGLAREFDRLGHETYVTHYENVGEASEDADLILSLGAGGVLDRYQSFGNTDALYWWWACGGYQDKPGDMNFAENHLFDSEFDGIITNSRVKVEDLRERLPARHLHIGYDQTKIGPSPSVDKYECDVTYLGLANYKRESQYDMLLEPATEYRLKLYGDGWESTKYADFAEGILPRGDIADLYNSATVVLGLHHDYIKLGMVNGRVFRALATDSIFVDQYHEQLDEEMGEYINLVSSKAEMSALLEDVFTNPKQYREQAKKGGEHVRSHHTYEQKAREILDFYTGSVR